MVVFLSPLHDNFSLDLGKIEENIFFVADVSREGEMGLVFTSLGTSLLKLYEEYAEMDFTNAELQIAESISSVLRSLGLAKSVDIEEKDGELEIYIKGVRVRELCSENCSRIACPICSSILLSLTKAYQQLIATDSFSFDNNFIKITAKKIGGVSDWM